MVHCVPMSGLIDSRKLYSTLRVSLLEKEGGEVAEALYDYAACYEQDIAKAMEEFRTERFPTNDLMRYFSLPHKQLETAIRSKVLSYLSWEAGRQGSSRFSIPFDRQGLADYLSVDRSALSQELGNMRREGLLDFHKNHFLLLAPAQA